MQLWSMSRRFRCPTPAMAESGGNHGDAFRREGGRTDHRITSVGAWRTSHHARRSHDQGCGCGSARLHSDGATANRGETHPAERPAAETGGDLSLGGSRRATRRRVAMTCRYRADVSPGRRGAELRTALRIFRHCRSRASCRPSPTRLRGGTRGERRPRQRSSKQRV